MPARRLKAIAERNPDDPFLLFEDRCISWGQMADVAGRAAGLLSDNGVTRGSRVLLAADNSPTFLYLWFALRWLGATCVPLHTASPQQAIERMVASSGVSHVVGDLSLRERVLAAAPHLEASAVTFENAEHLEAVVAEISLLDPVETGRFEECTIVYTSGTTGTPKGVVLSNEALLTAGERMAEILRLSSDDRILIGLPLFHTNPLAYGVMTALHAGCSLAVLRDFVAGDFIAEAARYGATGFTYVGTVLSLISKKTATVPEHKLRFCVGGGAPVRVWEDIEQRFGVTVCELYGMTETGGWVTMNGFDERRTGSCGVVRPDMQCAILDGDDFVLPPGQVGQIALRPLAPGVLFDRYHGDAEGTLQKFSNAWFHTGDLGCLDDDGFLHFRGRTDDVIRRGGENVSLEDVEAALTEHPSVQEAAAVGVEDEVMGHEIKAVLVTDPDFDVHTLWDFLAGRLPAFARPRYVEQRRDIPRTATQKIIRAELRRDEGDVIDLRASAISRDLTPPPGQP